MNILFVSQYYPPEIGAASNRIHYFAEFLAKNGHFVSVLTSTPNYPEGKIYPGHYNRYSAQKTNGVTVHRTRIYFTAKSNAIARIAHYLSFVLFALIAKRKIEKPDVIIASSPPLFTGLIGAILRKLWRTRLVLDIRDLWPESVESVGAIKNRRLLRQGERLAHYLYRTADRITATSPGIQKKLPESAQKKVTVLPNGAELDLFRPDIEGEGIRRRWNLGEKFVALYTGNLGLAQAPEVFIDAAEILKQVRDDIILLIVGAGVLLPALQQEASRRNLENIIFAGNQPRHTMPEFVAASDCCIIPYKKNDTFRNTLPSKMFDYMAGGKPFIINLEGEASALMEDAECGLLAAEEDAKDLAKKILELKKNPALAQKLGAAGRAYVEKNYRREVIARHLAELIETL